MSEGERKQILCGKCHVAIKLGADAQGQPLAICPNCGASDTVENATREAMEYFTDKTMRDLTASTVEGVRGITVTHSPKRDYRFISD
jgi:hypothetical protein